MVYKNEHIRNLIVQTCKIAINENIDFDDDIEYSIEDLQNKFYFRQKDISVLDEEQNIIDNLFFKRNDHYIFKKEYVDKIKAYISNNKSCNIDNNDIDRMLEIYDDYIEKVNLSMYNSETFDQMYNSIASYLENIHWHILPIYDDKFIADRNILPEDDVKEYYNDFYTLRDLIEWLKKYYINNVEWKPSLKGDCNLNANCKFNVYSRRWGHYDSYRISRTLQGWFVEFISINGPSEKDGTGTLINNLQHDNIIFPEAYIQEAMSTLWELADENEMSVKELQIKLSDIANWISEVEKTIGEYKPNWCL